MQNHMVVINHYSVSVYVRKVPSVGVIKVAPSSGTPPLVSF